MKPALRNATLITIRLAVLAGIVAGSYCTWDTQPSQGQGDGFVFGNGRIEATEMDVSTRQRGRVQHIFAHEGEFVVAGQRLALMQVDTVQAERDEVVARRRQTLQTAASAEAEVAVRERECQAADAAVQQRKSELEAAHRRLARTEIVEAALRRSDTALLDCEVRAPRDGSVQDWLAEPGEKLEAGGAVLRMLDLAQVFMTFLLPETIAGRVALGSEVRIVLDGVPQFVIPAKVSSLASVTNVPSDTPATARERQKLMFRVKAQIDRELLRRYLQQVTTGRSGVVWVRVDPHAEWPAVLNVSPELILRARS
jgi:HlyD family secretion protein